MSDNNRYVAKWINPKNQPVPLDKIFIALIKNEVHPIKWNPDIDVFCTFEQLYNDYGSICPGIKEEIIQEDIIAWMPLPEPIEEKFCQKTFEYYLDFEEEV